MNTWFFLSLAAPLFWAFSNILDSALRRRFIQDDSVMTWLVSIGRLPFAIVGLIFVGINGAPLVSVVGMVLTGALWMAPFFPYYKALQLEETSRVILLLQMCSIFILILAFFILDERLTAQQFIAFWLILFGGVLISFKKTNRAWHFTKAFWLALLASFLWALADVLFKKWIGYFPNFWQGFFLFLSGASLPGFFMLLSPILRQNIRYYGALLSREGWIMIGCNQILGVLGGLSFNYALTLGKASLTQVFGEFQAVFVFLFSLILAGFYPWVTREETDRSALLVKGFSFLILSVGVFYLF